MSERFHASRLVLARQRKGWTKVQLAEACEIAPRALAYYENGERRPPDETVASLAAALGVPESFFFADDVEPIAVGTPSFRALTKMTAGRRDAALAYGSLALQLNAWLEERFSLPRADVPRYENGATDPFGSARRLRAAWGLGEAPITNVVHLLESHGVRVFSLPEHLDDVDAFSLWWKGTPVVLLNTRKSAERGRFDAAHELGHLVMHADWDTPRSRERELEANKFASAFLMPEADVLAAGLRNAGVERILRAKSRWGVAAMALTFRLHELGLTGDWVYYATCRELATMGYRRSEPGGALRETSQLLGKALQELRDRGISLPELSRQLHLHPADLQQLVFGLALTALSGKGSATTHRADLKLVR